MTSQITSDTFYVSFPVNEYFQKSSVKQQSSVCSNATQLGLSQFPGPLNWYLWKVLREFALVAFGLCTDPIGFKSSLGSEKLTQRTCDWI